MPPPPARSGHYASASDARQRSAAFRLMVERAGLLDVCPSNGSPDDIIRCAT